MTYMLWLDDLMHICRLEFKGELCGWQLAADHYWYNLTAKQKHIINTLGGW